MTQTDQIIRNIDADKYVNRKSKPSDQIDLIEQRRMLDSYLAESERVRQVFFRDCLNELGLQDHPKAEIFCRICWELGPAYRVCWGIMQKIAKLMR